MSEPSNFPPLTDYAPPLEPVKTLFADSDLLVIDKPSGLLTVPGKTAMLRDCLETRVSDEFPTARLVHRLDMDTSGAIAFGLTAAAQINLGQQFEKRSVSKRYQAVVAGQLAENAGIIDLPLGSDWPNRPLQKVCHKNGRPAQTKWQVIAREADRTRVDLRPITGRTHQLRVHMLAIGHPILGDRFYGDQVAAPRLLLHAAELTLHHPVSGDRLTLSAPIPF